MMNSGVYAIFNNKTNAVYVGKSKDIKDRFWNHVGKLRSGKHRNCHLQRAWNKYGESSFEFKVIEFCDGDLLSLERRYADFFEESGFRLYNLKECGYGREKVSQETREKISLALKGRKKSPEHAAKISTGQKGKIISDAMRLNMSIAHRGKKQTKEMIDKRRISLIGKKRSEEFKMKHSIRMSAIFAKKKDARAALEVQ
jgi:group I intron endonuclease